MIAFYSYKIICEEFVWSVREGDYIIMKMKNINK